MKAPGPGIASCLSNVWFFYRNPLDFMHSLQEKYGDFVQIWMGPKLFFLVFHPDYAQHILQQNQKNYLHSRLIFDKLIPLTGEKGLVQLEGATWKKHRQMTNVSFKPKELESFVPTIVDIAQQQLKLIPENTQIDISDYMTDLVLQTAAKILFGSDIDDDISQITSAFLQANRCSGNRIKSILHFPEWIPSPNNIKFHRAVRTLDEFAYKIIKKRHETESSKSDMLASLMAVRDEETGEALSDLQLRDHTMTFLFAGHETTACSLAWCFYLLSQHPEIEAKMREEIQQVLGDRLPTHKDLMQLKYTSMVYQEALRLYPPAWILAREPVNKDEMCGWKIPKNCNILLSVWEMQRHKDFWSSPEKFNPERFSPENSKGRHKLSFYPFGAGPRICSGTNLALLEGVLILTVFYQNHHFVLESPLPIEIETTITARPKYGIIGRVQALSDS